MRSAGLLLALLVIVGVCAILAAAWMYGDPAIAR